MTELPEPPVPADADLHPQPRPAWRAIGDIIRPVVKTAIVEAGRREFISVRQAEDLIQQMGGPAMKLRALKPFPIGLAPFATDDDLQRLRELDNQAADLACTHERSELRRRTLSNGAIQIVPQCLTCGQSVGNPVKKTDAQRVLPPWDETIRSSYEDRRCPFSESKKAFWILYERYLSSPAWSVKREQVIRRCANQCEGCGTAAVEHVHHLTYEHVGRELLFELVGLCLRCHEIAHDDGEPGDDDQGPA